MEKSTHSSFLKSLALAFGDGLAFGVAVKLAQGPSKTREDMMTDLGPLAERLRKVEDRIDHTQTIDREALTKFGEGLDGRVLEKVILALEARLNEHAGVVDRRLAEIDAQVALDLKAVDTHIGAQTNAVEKALQQIETQVRDYVTAAQQAGAEQVTAVDQRLSALQEALPVKFREIVEAVRQSMEARVALELTEMENRVKSGILAPEHLRDLETRLKAEVEALAGKLSAEMHALADLAEQQQSRTQPLEQALAQLETKLATLREELPPKIRQIVEAVESSMEARIAAGDRQADERLAGFEQTLNALRDEMPSATGFRQALDDKLQQHAEQVGALDQKLTVLQEELPPKIKAIVDALRESLDARMAAELQSIEARFDTAQEKLREQLAADPKLPALEQQLVRMQADFSGMTTRLEAGDRRVADHLSSLEQHAAQVTAGIAAEMESLRTQQSAGIDQLRQSLETKLASEIHALKASALDRAPELAKALQYTTLLETRVELLEEKLQKSRDEAADRAAERVWQVLEARLQQRAPAPPPTTVTGLRQKSASAEQNVLDLIAGIGQLFEKAAPPAAAPPPQEPEPPAAEAAAPPAVDAAPAAPIAEPEAGAEAEAAVIATPGLEAPEVKEPETPEAEAKQPETPAVGAKEPEAKEPEVKEPEAKAPEVKGAEAQAPAAVPAEEKAEPEPAAALAAEAIQEGEPAEDAEELEPVEQGDGSSVLFRPRDTGRKWRIPFVSSFLLMTIAFVWLQFL